MRPPTLDVLDLLIFIEVHNFDIVILDRSGASAELIFREVCSNFSLPSITKIRKGDSFKILVILISLDLN